MFEELPITIKSSYLVNVMMAELALSPNSVADRYSAHLELGTRRWGRHLLASGASHYKDLRIQVFGEERSRNDGERGRVEQGDRSLRQVRQRQATPRQHRLQFDAEEGKNILTS